MEHKRHKKAHLSRKKGTFVKKTFWGQNPRWSDTEIKEKGAAGSSLFNSPESK